MSNLRDASVELEPACTYASLSVSKLNLLTLIDKQTSILLNHVLLWASHAPIEKVQDSHGPFMTAS
jgi:hypothetical protein